MVGARSEQLSDAHPRQSDRDSVDSWRHGDQRHAAQLAVLDCPSDLLQVSDDAAAHAACCGGTGGTSLSWVWRGKFVVTGFNIDVERDL